MIKFVNNETVSDYVRGIARIVTRGIKVSAIVCDGRKGIVRAFPEIPVQICQFHQVKNVTKYLTKKPKTAAAIELKAVSAALVHCSEKEFTALLDRWYTKWGQILNPTLTPKKNFSDFS
ncbi:MAG: transposase [Bacteroidales bacterium]|nr:transposase [Bacteroidales bacterium]